MCGGQEESVEVSGNLSGGLLGPGGERDVSEAANQRERRGASSIERYRDRVCPSAGRKRGDNSYGIAARAGKTITRDAARNRHGRS